MSTVTTVYVLTSQPVLMRMPDNSVRKY